MRTSTSRIPAAELERVKALDLVRLMEADGLVLKRIGKDLACACPFHAGDREPSLIVSPGTNLFHCFGCGAAGSPVDFVMRRRGVSFRRAVELLRAELGEWSADTEASDVPRAAASRIVAPLSAGEDAALLAEVVEFYRQTLKASPEALAYLARRGLTHPGLIDQFQLGYANRTLAYRLPEKQVAAGAKLRGALQRLGVLRASGHEHLQGSLVVPLFDAAGAVTGLYGRKIGERQRPGTPLHLFLPGPHRGVFNRTGLRGAQTVVLCEALIDALSVWCAGEPAVTSAYGVGGCTAEILDAIAAERVERVLIAFDGDAAGERGARALAPLLAARGIAAWRVEFPEGLDANACLQVDGAQALRARIGRARVMEVGGEIVGAVDVIEVAGDVVAAVESIESPMVEPAPEALPSPASASLEVAAPATPVEILPLAAALAPALTVPADAAGELIEHSPQQIVIGFGCRRWRVRGLTKNLSAEALKVNLMVSAGALLHLDTLDLYAAKARAGYVRQAASALEMDEAPLAQELTALLLRLEGLQNTAITAAVAPQAPAEPDPALREAALALLCDPRLCERIVADVTTLGVVGEDRNALVGYLACVSRKLAAPLAALIQSTSAAGKSTLMEALLSLMPEGERVHYSAMTGQSLFYLGQDNLKHKILAIAEEEGVRQASYALKLLQSQGELSIASTGKDPLTGKLVTEEYRVEGPVMLFLTSTAIDLDEELLNRCLVLTIDESREQTEAIHRRQRQARTLAGLVASREAEAIRSVHRAAQALLQPVAVVNPYAQALTFRSERTRMRRDHQKYLTLIDAIAYLRQYQKPVKRWSGSEGVGEVAYIEADLADIELANRLAHEVLGRSLDELPPQTRRVLGELDAWVRARCAAEGIARRDLRFTRREVRALTGMQDTQARVHLERLLQMEYLLAHRGQRGQSFVYELVFDGARDAGGPQLCGLIEVAALAGEPGGERSSRGEERSSRGAATEFAGSSRPQRGPIAAGSRGVEIVHSAHPDAAFTPLAAESPKTTVPRWPQTAAPETQRSNGYARSRASTGTACCASSWRRAPRAAMQRPPWSPGSAR